MTHTQLDAAHFDSKARQWDDNPVFRERGLKIADAIRKAVLGEKIGTLVQN